ncbi:uncharacterized protein HMPREF1541_04016 [Cyphellophora europaea CBS 101466]|uniref:Uncharacterized protein n=1 Tax=Cyphellophora europaea (strain CBS 101466) TaxID=1220924 RepID=W2S063_CYPE1|nr:uncharacterized protein HMPREF1541_04016 [Cyphellophora europaea CBS 101466]ETN42077.1 hypothetical protein HMPREF1541_04016 [Cyphellophora europaea CBS 101466]
MANPPDDKYAIHAAAREGRLAAVEALLANNPSLATLRDPDSRLALHWAAAYAHADIVRLLSSSKNFDPDATDASDWTALMMASSLKDDAGLEIVQFLLQKEAEPKAVSSSGATALHFASSKGSLEVCRVLLKAGAGARVRDRRAQVPLHRAAAVGSVPIVRLLLEHKSPVNGGDVDGMTPLHQAISEGHGDVAVELLKAGADTDKRDSDGRTALDCAPDKKVREFVEQAAAREGIELGE